MAGCAELRWVETLRIHHQGPHKDPGRDVLLLLESPHLTRRCKLLVLAVVARGLECGGCTQDMGAALEAEGLGEARRAHVRARSRASRARGLRSRRKSAIA